MHHESQIQHSTQGITEGKGEGNHIAVRTEEILYGVAGI